MSAGEDLWSATPELRRIRDAAHARLVSAPALLVYVLARVLAETPPGVALPPVVGGRASLNLGVAVVGGSGAGKSALLDVSRETLGRRGLEQVHIERGIGSGEGLAQTFLRKEDRDLVLVDDPRRIVTVDEVDTLGAGKNRSGATIAPTLRSALTGGALGQANATEDRNRHIVGGTYRLLLLLGVQPTRSEALLGDADAGTPQRLVWVSALDPSLPDDDVPWPGSLDWRPPVGGIPPTIDYPEHVRAEVREARRALVRDADADPLAGHRHLLRLKVGAALALLHGEVKISDEWWDLAGLIVDASTTVQEHCQEVLRRERQRGQEAAAVAQARAADTAEDDRVQRAGKAILRKLRTTDDWLTWHQVRPGAALRGPVSEDALAALVSAGQVEVDDYVSDKGNKSRRFRFVGGV